MKTSSLESITLAKAELARELRELEKRELELRTARAVDVFSDVAQLLYQYSQYFSAKQKAQLVSMLGESPSCPKDGRSRVMPKYWLPHTGDTWSGRGKCPVAFVAWERTPAHQEWKRRHPGERFPAYPEAEKR